jgi:peptide chain release factor 1
LESIVQSLKALETATQSIEELKGLLSDKSTDSELRELAEEDLVSTNEELEGLSTNLKRALTPKHPFADLPCLIEIKPGVGGGEANLFAADLLRMYKAYCARTGLRVSVLKYETAEGTQGEGDPPLQEAILEIENPGSYGLMRCESGVHRVQRVPATEAKGRTHTSAVGVLILPNIPMTGGESSLSEADLNDPESDYYVNPTEVRTDVMRARGAGGQHVNTTDSAVRLTHIPTGTVVAMQDSRSQHKNREKAWNILRSRLAQLRREKREEEIQKVRQAAGGGTKLGRGDKVRTYNWGDQRVTDHRSKLSVYNLDDVMNGGEELEKIMESVRVYLSDMEIEDLILEEEAKAKELAGTTAKGQGKKK